MNPTQQSRALTPEDARIIYKLKMDYLPGLREESAWDTAARRDYEIMREITQVRRQARLRLNALYGVELAFRLTRHQQVDKETP